MIMKPVILRPSSAHRWSSCTESIRMENRHKQEYGETPTSPYAEKGSSLHKIAEVILRGGGIDNLDEYKKLLFAQNPILEIYINYIESLRASGSYFEELFEEHVNIYDLTSGPFRISGTPDYAINIPERSTLYVVDLKTGYQRVEPDNEQLLLYSYGLLRRFSPFDDPFVNNIDRVVTIIIQPPLEGVNDDYVRRFVRPKGHVVYEVERLRSVIEEVLNGNTEFSPNVNTCMFCPAKLSCLSYTTAQLNQRKFRRDKCKMI